MRILVTGHSGLIGSHLGKQLVSQGHEVYGISQSSRNYNTDIHNLQLDLRDRESAALAVKRIKPEIIYHLAANAAENLSMFSPIEITTTNYNTFFNVITPAIATGQLKRFVFTSSIAVYGAIHIPFRESDLPLPQDIYGITKLAIEQALKQLSSVHDFEYVVVRPHNVFGEGQRMDDKFRNVVTLFMNSLLKGKPYTIYGDGSMRRCFSYVKDVVDVISKCGSEDVAGLTFNVGSDKFYSLQELSNTIQKVSEIYIKPTYLPTRVHEVHTAVSDHTLCKKVLGYHDTSFEEAIQNTWEYCKKEGPIEYSMSRFEITSNKLPKNWL